MPNLFFRGRRDLSVGLQLQQKDHHHMAGNLFIIKGHVGGERGMLNHFLHFLPLLLWCRH